MFPINLCCWLLTVNRNNSAKNIYAEKWVAGVRYYYFGNSIIEYQPLNDMPTLVERKSMSQIFIGNKVNKIAIFKKANKIAVFWHLVLWVDNRIIYKEWPQTHSVETQFTYILICKHKWFEISTFLTFWNVGSWVHNKLTIITN